MIEMKDRKAGLEDGEVMADDEGAYFTKRCVCCTFWITFVFVLLSCAGVGAQIWFMDGNFLSGAFSKDESKAVVDTSPVETGPVEIPWTWSISSGSSPTIKKTHEFGDSAK